MTASTHLAHVVVDGVLARRLSDALSEVLDPADTAVAAFESAGGRWTVEINFATAPEPAAIRRLVRGIAGDDVAQRLSFTTVAARDWVAASLAGLAPVAAGRFLVHGAHDRASGRA